MASTPQLLLLSACCAVGLKTCTPEFAVRQSYIWSTFTIFAILVLVVRTYSFLIYPFFISPLRHLPQPPNNHFLWGHGPQIFAQPSGEPMREWASSTPNNGLLRYLNWFNKERVLVVGPKALSEVLVTKNYDFIKPSMTRIGLARLLGNGILLAEGDQHKQQRRDLAPAFAFRHVKDLYPSFWSTSLQMLATIDREMKLAAQTEHGPNVINVGDYTSRATLDIIGNVGMGQDFSSLQDPSNEFFTTYKALFTLPPHIRYLQLLSLVVPMSVIRALPMKRNHEVDTGVRFVRDACKKVITERRKALDGKESHNFDILSVAMESGGFTDDNMVDQMMTFLVAGHETTATAMVWAIYALCKRPELQQQVRNEVRAHLASPRTDAGKTIRSTQIDSLPLLNATCAEVLRLHSPVRITFREAYRETSVSGQRIPKGTLMVLAPFATNNVNTYWGDDVDEFRPERWLTEGQVNKQGGADSNFNFMTFLHGPRSCIGEKFARGEFACLLAAWVGRYSFEFEDPTWVAEVAGGITAKPKGGLWAKMTEVEGW